MQTGGHELQRSRADKSTKKNGPVGGPSSIECLSAAATDLLDNGPAVLPLLNNDGAAAAGIDADAVMAVPGPIAVAARADTNIHAASLATPDIDASTFAAATTLAAVTIAALATLA